MSINNGNESKGSIICLGGSQESLPIIQKIWAMGYRPIILDGNRDCAGHRWAILIQSIDEPVGDKYPIFIKADCYNPRSCLQALNWAVKKERHFYDDGFFSLEDVVGCLCCAVDAPDVQAAVAEKYRLPTIGVELAKFGKNKYYQWYRLASCGIVTPPCAVVSPEMNWSEVQHYQIVKPVDSRGARGVRFFDETNYREAFAESLEWSHQRMIVAQKFIPGRQLSTESVVWRGEVWLTSVFERNYDRLQEFHPYIVEDGGESVDPSRLNHHINKLIERCCKFLGWDNLTVKADLVLDGAQMYVIELAPRLSGGYLSTHSTPLSMGWDIVGDAIRLAVGGKPTLELDPGVGSGRHVAQRYVFPAKEHIGRVISRVPEFPSGVNFCTWNVKVGDTIQRVQHHPSRLGQVIVTGETHTEAVAKAEKAVAEMQRGIEVI